jgi:hypothetical protein
LRSSPPPAGRLPPPPPRRRYRFGAGMGAGASMWSGVCKRRFDWPRRGRSVARRWLRRRIQPESRVHAEVSQSGLARLLHDRVVLKMCLFGLVSCTRLLRQDRMGASSGQTIHRIGSSRFSIKRPGVQVKKWSHRSQGTIVISESVKVRQRCRWRITEAENRSGTLRPRSRADGRCCTASSSIAKSCTESS